MSPISTSHQQRHQLEVMKRDIEYIDKRYFRHDDILDEHCDEFRTVRKDISSVQKDLSTLEQQSIVEQRKQKQLMKEIRQLNIAVFGLVIVLGFVVLLVFLILSSLL